MGFRLAEKLIIRLSAELIYRLGIEFKNLRIEYKVAVIGGIIAILGSVLSTILTESGVIKEIVKDWKTEEIKISASQKYSGIASKTSQHLVLLNTLKSTGNLVIGDDSNNKQSKLFLDFNLENIRATKVVVIFACSSLVKVFHERVSFFYLAQNLHNLHISSPSLYTDRYAR
ncbi:MAG: hypothetical protein V7K94_25550 [Nostoc sp.]|uniref:hypothetical protein n=1 Tax=Nostoc sp. TaxID=1180 RepID=UPI002FF68EE8